MKTPEEIKAAVLKEVGDILPIDGRGEKKVGQFTFLRSLITSRNFAVSFADEHHENTVIWLSHTIASSDARWVLFYKLLNLEARELEERAKGLAEALVDAEMAIDHARTICPSPKRRYFSTAIIKVETALNQWKGVPNV